MSKPSIAYTMPYSPLRLKRRVLDSGITQTTIVDELTRKGYKCSRSLLNLVINKGYLPRQNAEQFKKAFEEVLRSRGISTEGIWEKETEEQYPRKNEHPRMSHKRYFKKEGEVKDMNITKEYLELEEITHFGLEDDPFFDLNDHREIWMSPQLKVAERQVYRTIKSRGIIAITGAYGAGKSTFLRYMIRKLMEDKSIRIIMPDRLDRDMMTGSLLTEEIILQLGGTKVPRSAGQRDKLAKKLLDENMKAGIYTVLIIDEAHDLRERIFISLKRLWDSGMIFKLIAIVLVGAGGKDGASAWGLKGMIEHNPYIKEFSERCYMVDLGRLNGSISEYLDYRFKKVGRSVRDVFTDDALRLLQQKAKIPQLANNIAVRAIKNAYADGKTKVTVDHVNDV